MNDKNSEFKSHKLYLMLIMKREGWNGVEWRNEVKFLDINIYMRQINSF